MDRTKREPAPITDAELAELKRLYAAANTGTLLVDGCTAYSIVDSRNDVWFAVNVDRNQNEVRRITAAHSIAYIHNAFPALLARLEAAESKVKELQDASRRT